MKAARNPLVTRVIPLLLAMALGIGLAVSMQRRGLVDTPSATLPILAEVPPFALTDATGATYGSTQLAGRIWTANLFFTTCQSICPPVTRSLSALQDGIGRTIPFDLVSISVDPERDTPAAMTAFATQYGADFNRWHFLTGRPDAIADLTAKGLKLGAEDQPVNHSPYVALIDARGRVRGYYDAMDVAAVDDLERDIQRLATE